MGLRYLTFPVMCGGYRFALLGVTFITAGAAGLAAPEHLALPATLGLTLTELAVGTVLWRQWRSAD